MDVIFSFEFTTLIEILGTFAFALSGIRWASVKNFDWFGAYIIGLVTAIGGGSLRDVFLDVSPFWMNEPSYLIITLVALVVFLFFSRQLTKLKRTLFLFDAIGLGLFVVVGIEKTLQAGFDFWVAILMGMITGSVGGVLRDVLINETPLIFREDIYASTCVAGGVVYWLCLSVFQFSDTLTALAAALTIISIRVAAVRWHWHFPTLKQA